MVDWGKKSVFIVNNYIIKNPKAIMAKVIFCKWLIFLVGFLSFFHVNAQTDTVSEKYLKQLNSPDQFIRSNAATQLCKLKHPQAISACIRTINDDADMLHVESTPSVRRLIESGKPAILPLTELMLSGNEITRLRASKAIEEITYNMMNNPKNEKKNLEKWRVWWKEIDLKYKDPIEKRKVAVEKLKKWLANYKAKK